MRDGKDRMSLSPVPDGIAGFLFVAREDASCTYLRHADDPAGRFAGESSPAPVVTPIP